MQRLSPRSLWLSQRNHRIYWSPKSGPVSQSGATCSSGAAVCWACWIASYKSNTLYEAGHTMANVPLHASIASVPLGTTIWYGATRPDTLLPVELAAAGCELACPEAPDKTTDAERPPPPQEAGDAKPQDLESSRLRDSTLATNVEDITKSERRLWFFLRLWRALDREREHSMDAARPTPALGKAPESGTARPVPEPGKAPGLELGLLWEPTTFVEAGLGQAGLTPTTLGGTAAVGHNTSWYRTTIYRTWGNRESIWAYTSRELSGIDVSWGCLT